MSKQTALFPLRPFLPVSLQDLKGPKKIRQVFVQKITKNIALTFSQGNPVVVKRVEKDQIDLTRTVLLELKQVSRHDQISDM